MKIQLPKKVINGENNLHSVPVKHVLVLTRFLSSSEERERMTSVPKVFKQLNVLDADLVGELTNVCSSEIFLIVVIESLTEPWCIIFCSSELIKQWV